MSGTNHKANFIREFERRHKAKKTKYDYIDFAYDLYRQSLRMKKAHASEIQYRNKIEYGV